MHENLQTNLKKGIMSRFATLHHWILMKYIIMSVVKCLSGNWILFPFHQMVNASGSEILQGFSKNSQGGKRIMMSDKDAYLCSN